MAGLVSGAGDLTFSHAAGPAAGFAYVFGSFAEDYTNFITLFTEFPFCLTARTGDSYAFSQVFCVLPSLMVLLAGVVKIMKSTHHDVRVKGDAIASLGCLLEQTCSLVLRMRNVYDRVERVRP